MVLNYKLQQTALDYGDSHVEHALDIPVTPPTNIIHSKTIQVTYELKVVAKTSGMHDDIEMKIPLTIGTVPLYPVPVGHQVGQVSPGGSALQPIINPNYREYHWVNWKSINL